MRASERFQWTSSHAPQAPLPMVKSEIAAVCQLDATKRRQTEPLNVSGLPIELGVSVRECELASDLILRVKTASSLGVNHRLVGSTSELFSSLAL